MNEDNSYFSYNYDMNRNHRLTYGELLIYYIRETVEDVLEDFKVEVNEKELKDICLTLYKEVNITSLIDNALMKKLTDMKLIGDEKHSA